MTTSKKGGKKTAEEISTEGAVAIPAMNRETPEEERSRLLQESQRIQQRLSGMAVGEILPADLQDSIRKEWKSLEETEAKSAGKAWILGQHFAEARDHVWRSLYGRKGWSDWQDDAGYNRGTVRRYIRVAEGYDSQEEAEATGSIEAALRKLKAGKPELTAEQKQEANTKRVVSALRIMDAAQLEKVIAEAEAILKKKRGGK
jgi:hypothetical protein